MRQRIQQTQDVFLNKNRRAFYQPEETSANPEYDIISDLQVSLSDPVADTLNMGEITGVSRENYTSAISISS